MTWREIASDINPCAREGRAGSAWVAERQVVPRLPRRVRQIHVDVLELRVLLEAVHREVLPEAALLVAAVWHLAHERQVLVDLRGAEAHCIRHAEGLVDVLRPDA